MGSNNSAATTSPVAAEGHADRHILQLPQDMTVFAETVIIPSVMADCIGGVGHLVDFSDLRLNSDKSGSCRKPAGERFEVYEINGGAPFLLVDEISRSPSTASARKLSAMLELMSRSTHRDFFPGDASVDGVRRVHGRFGGDKGNRLRREEMRHETDIEHRIRVRNEKRAGQRAIVDGLDEYDLMRAAARPRASTHESRREDDSLQSNQVRQSRSGNVVEVIRVKKRYITKKALSGVVSRPTVSVDHVRSTLRLKPLVTQ